LKVGKMLKTKDTDYALKNIHSLSKEVPEIWSVKRKAKEDEIESTRSDLDIIRSTPIKA
jgi:hypothetical protein